MKIAVVGAQGQLGAAMVQELAAAAHEVHPITHRMLDITRDADVAAAMAALSPDAIVNCAAYNDVDGAESHPVDALNVNAFAVRALARAAADGGAALVHFSTDFVFDGTASSPYREEDRPNPRSVYAASKLLGEWLAGDAPRAYVLRVESLFGRAPGARPAKGSVAAIVKTLAAGGESRVFADRTVSPTYIIDAAAATRRLLETGAAPGVYHCVSSGYCTWLEFAEELARQMGVPARLQATRFDDYKAPAPRPKFCALANDKLRAAGFDMPTWQDAIGRYLEADPIERAG